MRITLSVGLAVLWLLIGDAAVAQAPSQSTPSAAAETYTIKFEGKSLAAAMGPTRRADQTHRRNSAGRLVLDPEAPRSRRFLDGLRRTQDQRLASIERALGRSLEVGRRFDVVLNGITVRMTAAEAALVSDLEFVEFVEREPIYQLDTYAGPPWIGADSIWDGSATVSGVGNRGEGMIAGVIDSGINTQAHPSFSETDDGGYTFTNPLGAGNYLGDCVGGTNGTDLVPCNAKLIGAYTFVGGTPEDTQAAAGHGSHTASTMAGNLVTGPVTDVNGAVLPVAELSGVAPRAHVIAYRGCGDSGCPGAATSAALQQALLDGVNATNFSIGPTFGGRGISPWQSSSNRIMLDLVAAGIFAAASAGNTRGRDNPNPEADVANKAPWIATIANSSHDSVIAHSASFSDNGGPATGLESIPAVPGTGPQLVSELEAPVFFAQQEDVTNFEGCNPWPGAAFSGGILLVSRGACNFSVKVNNAAAAGAIGVIVYNSVDGPPFGMAALEGTAIPAVMIPRQLGLDAGAFVAGSSSAIASIPPALAVVADAEIGNVLNTSSLKGPNLDFDVTEPDLTAPGTSILAATATGAAGDFRFLSGTSMSGPHVAGAGLLLLAEHPDWTPIEVLSALMMTANPSGRLADGTPVGPDDVGSGTVDLTKASLAGLVMDETFDNFLAADPSSGGDPRTLNLPSVRNSGCDPSCNWTRTVRNGSDIENSWTAVANSADEFDAAVSPASFELLPGDVIFRDGVEAGGGANSSFQTLTISVTNNAGGSTMRFGEVILTEASAFAPDARITIAVSQTPPAPPPL